MEGGPRGDVVCFGDLFQGRYRVDRDRKKRVCGRAGVGDLQTCVACQDEENVKPFCKNRGRRGRTR